FLISSVIVPLIDVKLNHKEQILFLLQLLLQITDLPLGFLQSNLNIHRSAAVTARRHYMKHTSPWQPPHTHKTLHNTTSWSRTKKLSWDWLRAQHAPLSEGEILMSSLDHKPCDSGFGFRRNSHLVCQIYAGLPTVFSSLLPT
ncbi:hypothetical protein ATANTOWER_021515, partial [Ataeniobius toweri]|nr:hypothetical protein [Ataeniobius toweri]